MYVQFTPLPSSLSLSLTSSLPITKPNLRERSIVTFWVPLTKSSVVFFLYAARSYMPNIYTHPYIFNTLLSFHHCCSNRLYPCLFRATYTPTRWIQAKWNKDFHCATSQPIINQAFLFGQSPGWVRRILNKEVRKMTDWTFRVRYCLWK